MLWEEHHEAYRADIRRFMDRVVEPARAELDLSKPLTREEVQHLRKKFSGHEIANSEPQREDGSPDLVAIGIFTEELNPGRCVIRRDGCSVFSRRFRSVRCYQSSSAAATAGISSRAGWCRWA